MKPDTLKRRLLRLEHARAETGNFLLELLPGETQEQGLIRYEAEGRPLIGPIVVVPQMCKTVDEWVASVSRWYDEAAAARDQEKSGS